MNSTAEKMTKIIDELVCFFFNVGSDGIKMDLQKREDGYALLLESGYDPIHRKKVDDLDKFLNVREKDAGLEQIYWQLTGVSSSGQDSELHLIGQMLDGTELEIGERFVKMTLYKKDQ